MKRKKDESITRGTIRATRIRILITDLQIRHRTWLSPLVRNGKPFFLAVTGHRPNKLGDEWTGEGPVSRVIQHYLLRQVERFMQQATAAGRPIYLVSGMALGVDQIFAQIAINKMILFIAALPCADQDSKWPPESRKKYRELLASPFCTVVPVSSLPYDKRCMQRRNEFMVDLCDTLIAVWDGSSGGTANCCRYAEKKQKTIVRMNPSGLAEQARLGLLEPWKEEK